jgi:hypothetical protein
VIQVVRGLLAGPARDVHQPLIRPGAERRIPQHLVRRQEQQLRHRHREVAVRQLHQQAVAEVPIVTQERQVVLGAPGRLTRVRQELPGRTELVEGDVGQRHVLLQLRRGRAPLGEPLRRDQRVVAESERVVGHRWDTPSGTS